MKDNILFFLKYGNRAMGSLSMIVTTVLMHILLLIIVISLKSVGISWKPLVIMYAVSLVLNTPFIIAHFFFVRHYYLLLKIWEATPLFGTLVDIERWQYEIYLKWQKLQGKAMLLKTSFDVSRHREIMPGVVAFVTLNDAGKHRLIMVMTNDPVAVLSAMSLIRMLKMSAPWELAFARQGSVPDFVRNAAPSHLLQKEPIA